MKTSQVSQHCTVAPVTSKQERRFQCDTIFLSLLVVHWPISGYHWQWVCSWPSTMILLNVKNTADESSLINVQLFDFNKEETVLTAMPRMKWAASWQNQQCGYVPSEDSDQPGLSLHWAHSHFVGFVTRRLKCCTESRTSSLIAMAGSLANPQ